jgi:4-amino-4-deoxy-L-arabinose transferase-like glycosyltransferase
MSDAARSTGRSIEASGTAAAYSIRRDVLLLTVVCLLLFLIGAASLPLTDQEEARCALIVREMIRSGNWLMPHLLGEPYFDKPAPFFWLAAAAEILTGNAALGGRLVAAVAALLAVLTTYALGRRIFGPIAGLIGGLALATSVQFWYMARWYRMDMPFAAAMWAAVAWFWICEGPKDGATPIPRWIAWCGFYLFCALATLFKGPAGLGLPVLIVGCYFLLTSQARRLLEFFNARGIAVFALVAVPWYAAVSFQEPSYAYEFLFKQNVMRFGTATLGHTWPGILFVPILLLGLIPWTIYLLPAMLRTTPQTWRSRGDKPQALFLWLAAIVPLVFFSFSKTKIAGYILPCFAPLAVLIGAVIAEWIGTEADDRLMRRGALALTAALVLMWGATVALDVLLVGSSAWIGVAGVAGAGTITMMMRGLARRHRGAFVAWTVAGFVALLTFVAARAERAGYERISAQTLAALVPEADRLKDDFVMWPKVRYSFAYYIDVSDQRRMQHIGREDIETIGAKLEAPGGVYVLVSGEANLHDLEARYRGHLNLVGHTGDMWLVSNHSTTWPTALTSQGR